MNDRNKYHHRPLLSRRQFLAVAAGSAVVFMTEGIYRKTGAAPVFELPPLPYPENALEPVISAETVGFHYGKHHRNYINELNKLIAGTEFSDMRLDEIMSATDGKEKLAPVFNNAAQSWNHAFYWKCLSPRGNSTPPPELRALIDGSFGSFEACKKELASVATARFGSGYAWLVLDGKTLKTMSTPNAENPLTRGLKPLLTLDVWEHAYYLDYQNRRGDHVNAVIDNLIDWQFAAENIEAGFKI